MGHGTSRAPALTEQDLLVLSLSATGLLTDEVAERLDISPDEVRRHVASAMAALGAAEQSQPRTPRGFNRFPMSPCHPGCTDAGGCSQAMRRTLTGGVLPVAAYPSEPSDAACWNCDRQAAKAVTVTLCAPSGEHVALTLCPDCHTATYLPLAAEAPELLAEGGPGKVVLIIDDDPDILDMLRYSLQAKGYAVDAAANGLEALCAACRRMPDIVVLDLHMPVMDGHTFIAAWREVTATTSIPIVAISAHEHQASAEELGVEAFVPKPFDLNALVATVDRLLTAAA